MIGHDRSKVDRSKVFFCFFCFLLVIEFGIWLLWSFWPEWTCLMAVTEPKYIWILSSINTCIYMFKVMPKNHIVWCFVLYTVSQYCHRGRSWRSFPVGLGRCRNRGTFLLHLEPLALYDPIALRVCLGVCDPWEEIVDLDLKQWGTSCWETQGKNKARRFCSQDSRCSKSVVFGCFRFPLW